MRQFDLLNELSVEIRRLYRLRTQILQRANPDESELLAELSRELTEASEMRFRVQRWLVSVARGLGMEDF